MATDIVFLFDTTGSMAPCATQVRHHFHQSVGKLFAELPSVRIGMAAFRDYDDLPRMRRGEDTYLYTHTPLVFESNAADLQAWISAHKPREARGDAREAYGEALERLAKDFSWRRKAKKVALLFGDDLPHDHTYYHPNMASQLWGSPVDQRDIPADYVDGEEADL